MSVGPILIRIFAAVVAIILPFPVAQYFHQNHGSPWSLFRWGCLTFIISQVLHLPFNAIILRTVGLKGTELPHSVMELVYLSIFLGLSAGLFEECTRYLAYRYRLTSPADRTFRSALMFGLGHGGVESILLVGLGGMAQLIAMSYLQHGDLESKGIPADQVKLLQAQIDAYWSIPWYGVLVGDLERVFAITAHIAMTILVLQAFRHPRGGILWLLAAISWHAGLDFTAVFLTVKYNPFIAEIVIGLWALASFGMILYFSFQEECSHLYMEIGHAADSSGEDTTTAEATSSEFERRPDE